MLKCNLKDLEVISDEDAQYCGYISQFDFYVFTLSYYDDLERANSVIRQMKLRAWSNRQDFKSIGFYKCAMGTEGFEDDYRWHGKLLKYIQENYHAILREYPNFREFIFSIANAPNHERR